RPPPGERRPEALHQRPASGPRLRRRGRGLLPKSNVEGGRAARGAPRRRRRWGCGGLPRRWPQGRLRRPRRPLSAAEGRTDWVSPERGEAERRLGLEPPVRARLPSEEEQLEDRRAEDEGEEDG